MIGMSKMRCSSHHGHVCFLKDSLSEETADSNALITHVNVKSSEGIPNYTNKGLLKSMVRKEITEMNVHKQELCFSVDEAVVDTVKVVTQRSCQDQRGHQ